LTTTLLYQFFTLTNFFPTIYFSTTSHLHLDFPNGAFSSGFLTRHSIQDAPINSLDLVALKIFSEEKIS